MKISIVIPVYNEAEHLEECLSSIAKLKQAPFEVIVVDNNSTDDSPAIASRFSFVTLLREAKQGVAYARTTGFNAAKGDIIGRIDADTVLPADWTQKVSQYFSQDKELMAVTGAVHYRDVALASWVNRMDLFWRRRMAKELGREVALQGANMAVRRSAWRSIGAETCHKKGLHEDFDLAIHLSRSSHKVEFKEDLVVDLRYRQANSSFKEFCRYALISPKTYLDHGVKSGKRMYKVVAFVIALYPIIKVISRGYDPEKGKFTLAKLFAPKPKARVNPATHIA